MVVKVQNGQNQTSWVHRYHLRYVPNRPSHLQPRTIVIPVSSDRNSSKPAPKPPSGVRSGSRNVGSGTSRIPRFVDRPIQIIQNNRRSLPLVQNRISNVQPVQRRRSRQSMIGPSRPPIRRSIPPARPNRPTRASLLRNQQIEQNVRRNPPRNRRPPRRFEDFQMS